MADQTSSSTPNLPSEGAKVTRSRVELSQKKKALLFCILVGGAVVLTLLLMEVGLRLFMRQPLSPPLYSDMEFGFWNRADLKSKQTQSDEMKPYSISTDSNGFRSRKEIAPEKTSGVRRVMVIGDSFVYGVGVEDDETFAARTEQYLNALDGKSKYEVINAGCPGWGTENELAFWSMRGHQYKPDLLVIAFYPNDLSDNVRGLLYDTSSGSLRWSPKPAPIAKRIVRNVPFYPFLCEHSHLLNFLRRSIARRYTKSPMLEMPAGAGTENEKPVPGDPTGLTLAMKTEMRANLARQVDTYRILMEAFIAKAEEYGVPMLLVLLPGTEDLEKYPGDELKQAKILGVKWAEEGEVTLLDPYMPLRRVNNERPVCFLKDRHYNIEGNEIMGRVLAEEIARMLENPEE